MLRTSILVLVLGALVTVGGLIESQGAQFENSRWTEPVNLGLVNSPSNEQNAFLSKDGLSLYFTSNRPGGFGGLDIYVSHRASVESAWGPGVNLGATINTAFLDFGPNLSADGHLLFFASTRPGGQGGADIYVSRRVDPRDDFAWPPPVNVGPPLNSADFEQAPFYLQNAEDGSGNVYFNRGLQAEQRADIYYAAVTRRGAAIGGEVFVAELSSPVNDFAVSLRHDGREVFFTSQRPGSDGVSDLWTSTRQSIHHPWQNPVNAGAPPNSKS